MGMKGKFSRLISGVGASVFDAEKYGNCVEKNKKKY